MSNNVFKDRNRFYFRHRRAQKKLVVSSIISVEEDQRLYANISIAGISYKGLLDSGANVSILGKGSEVFLNHPSVKFHSLPSTVKTAGGETQRVFGYVTATFKYGQKSGVHTFYIVPSLSQDLYLGIDFWHKAGIMPIFNEELNKNVEPLVCDVDKNRHELTKEQNDDLKTIITKFPNSSKIGIGKTSLLEHKIELLEEKPIKQRYYPMSPAVQREVYEELDRMLSLGVIEESHSPWCSPMALVRKKSGKARLCLDARKINEKTKKDAYPLPIIEGLLSRLDATYYISTLDLKDAFWQIPLESRSREITAFTVQGRPLYQFRVMPFGLCNAAQTLCRLMHRVIPHQLHDRVFVYLDDLLVTSSTFEEHLKLLELVADRLSQAGLTINIDKSQFCLKHVEYLGYVVGGGCLRVNDAKVGAIAEYPIPRTVRQVRRFLGMTGWYRRFIPSYSSLSAPLTDLLKKGIRFEWTETANLAFCNLKKALCSAPVLKHPDFRRMFYIQCDASKDGVGSVLFQRSETGEDNPIAFFSQKLNSAQRNYSITELECLAAVLSVKKFRAYVEGQDFTIITDHSSLQWLMNQSDLSGRLARWSLKLQSFHFKIEHCRGVTNTVPDALSRMYSVEAVSIQKESVDSSPHIDMSDPSFVSPEYLALVKNVDVDTCHSNVIVRDGKAFINTTGSNIISDTDLPDWKLIIPTQLTHQLIEQAHIPPISAHQGVAKTLELLRRYFYWKGMAREVKDFVGHCQLCKMSKPVNFITRPPMGEHIVTVRPFQRLYCDFLGPYPRTSRQNTYILIVIDQFSRFVMCKPVRAATSKEIVKYLSWIFNLFEVPETLFSDNGKQLKANELKKFLGRYGVKRELTPKYSPHPNISERVNRSILAAIRSYVDDTHSNWDIHLDEICSALRNTVHESTKYSPHYIVFCQHYVSHGQTYDLVRRLEQIEPSFLKITEKIDRMSSIQKKVIENLRLAYEKHSKSYNLRSRVRVFTIGQFVYVRNFVQSKAIEKFAAKLAPKFIKGKIIRKVGNVAFEVENMAGKSIGVYHMKDIRS